LQPVATPVPIPSANVVSPSPVNNPVKSIPVKPQGYVGMSEDDMVLRNIVDIFSGQIVDLDEEPSD
jgi:hypothetical protein